MQRVMEIHGAICLKIRYESSFALKNGNIFQRSILYDGPQEFMERREDFRTVPEKKQSDVNSKTHLKYALRSPEVKFVCLKVISY